MAKPKKKATRVRRRERKNIDRGHHIYILSLPSRLPS